MSPWEGAQHGLPPPWSSAAPCWGGIGDLEQKGHFPAVHENLQAGLWGELCLLVEKLFLSVA